MKFLTLLTDFGLKDVYVAVMKGVIAQIAPDAVMVDLTHNIPPQDLATGRYQWMTAYPYWPAGTVHLAVVDPGVGTTRRGIAVQLPSGWLVAPDNGLISGILSLETPIAAVELTNRRYWRTPQTSFTFHGRDIFAPVAAHLLQGVPLTELGHPIPWQTLVQLPLAKPQCLPDGRWQGVVQAVDHFGNLITNLRGELIGDRAWSVEIGNRDCPAQLTYAAGGQGELVGVVGSGGWLEIAVPNGSAQALLGLGVGTPVRLVRQDH
jgi:S-adenosylmethionine hydrolase